MQGRYLWQHFGALLAGNGQGAHFAGAHLLGHGGDRIEHHVHLPADDIRAGARAAFVGDVDHVDLRHAFEQFASQPDVRQAWGKQGATPLVMNPAAFEKYVQDDVAKWARVIKSANIKMD
jgi:hypothetical protein